MISLYFATGKDGEFGADDGLPWERNKNDMEFFKESTTGKVVIMGYNTFKSLGFKPLPNRYNIVITKELKDDVTGMIGSCGVQMPDNDNLMFIKPVNFDQRTLTTLISYIHSKFEDEYKEVCVIGGKKLLEAALPIAEEINHTVILTEITKEVTVKLFLRGFFEYLQEPSLFTKIGELNFEDKTGQVNTYIPTVRTRF